VPDRLVVRLITIQIYEYKSIRILIQKCSVCSFASSGSLLYIGYKKIIIHYMSKV